MDGCIFCNIISRKAEAEILFENEYVCCFLDKYPINKGHVLVVPKRHYPEFTDVDPESLTHIIWASQKVAFHLQKVLQTDGITIMQNNGAFKDVDHYHMHIIPRHKQDGFSWIEPDTAVSPEEFAQIGSMLRSSLSGG